MVKIKKPLSRETAATAHEVGKERNIIVTLEPRTIGFRLKGTRRTYYLGIEGLYHLAVIKTLEKEKPKRKLKKIKRR